MNVQLSFLWLITLLPIIISPGPANVLYAASGSSFGIRKTVPFWLGTNFASVFQTLAVGFGLDYVLSTYPEATIVIKYVGVAFLLYLAYKFFRISKSTEQVLRPLSFKDGIVIELLNAKYLLVPTIMFSQFYMPQQDGYAQIFFLTFALVSLTLTTSMLWILGGNTLASLVSRDKIQKSQGYLFGSLLAVTALWLAFN